MEVPQSSTELIKHLKEQMQFIVASSSSYDNGFEGEAKRLATSIRILVHDTNRSKSLLEILGVKESIQYHSYLEKEDYSKTMAFVGLSMRFTDEGLRYYPKAGQPEYKLTFQDWWNQPVIYNKKNNINFSRKNIILAVSNKDGGAHVDPNLSERYAKLSRMNGFGWEVFKGEEEQGVVNGPELPIVRQTAYELYTTLASEFNNTL
ncbi:hypothetical protein ABEY55_20045 [Priestia aryabhattai]|uniref:hypothetical protein n=1 Tax=Priestia aryabhattai TaxID=412384 RepID=UPI003D27A338